MSPDEIKSARKVIGVTQRDLAELLEVDVVLVRDWEKGERFPTLAHCRAIEKLRENPPPKRKGKAKSPMELLADPDFMTLLRKLLVHGPLRAEVDKLASGYSDPLDDEADTK